MESIEQNLGQLLPKGIIHLERKSQVFYAARSFRVYIDQQKVGRIANGAQKDYEVSPGIHTVQIRIDFYRSELLQVDVRPNQVINLRCGQNLLNIFILGLGKYLIVEEDTETVTSSITNTFLGNIYLIFYLVSCLIIFAPLISGLLFTKRYVITSNAMSPTIKLGERIIVDKYFNFPPNREEIVVIKHQPVPVKLSEEEKLKLSKIYKQNELSNMYKEYTVKRIIGLPGEKIDQTRKYHLYQRKTFPKKIFKPKS